ncbi:MAG TPA: hypothetical protein DHV62_06870 [Elusimicrobia bacterium]|nr:hypothetical protein [Elusimicrobiota bacterium]
MLYTFEPTIIYFNVALYTDIFALFVFMFSLVVLVWALKNNNLLFFALSGLILGMATLVKPIFQFFPVVMIIIIISGIKNINIYKFKAITLFTGFFLLTLLPWQLRNLRVGGHFCLSTISSSHPYRTIIRYEVSRTGKSFKEVSDGIGAIIKEKMDKKGIVDGCPSKGEKIRKKIFFDFFKKYWPVYISIHIKGMCRLFLTNGSYMFYKMLGGIPTEIIPEKNTVDINYIHRFKKYITKKTMLEIILFLLFSAAG